MSSAAQIYIYRNLSRGGFSLRYKGRVVDHADSLYVVRPQFIVSAAGNLRVRREKKKYVHSYIVGENGAVSWPFKCGNPAYKGTSWVEVYYNPYTTMAFRTKHTNQRIFFAAAAILSPNGVYVLDPNLEYVIPRT